MANEIVKIYDTGDRKHGKQMRVGNDIYVVRVWLADDGFHQDEDKDMDAYQMSLRKVVANGNAYIASSQIATMKDGSLVLIGLSESKIKNEYQNDMRIVYKTFKDKVEAFLLENEAAETVGYPINGTYTEQILWLIKTEQ